MSDVDERGNCAKCGGAHYGTGPTCVYEQPDLGKTAAWPTVESTTERYADLERALREKDALLRRLRDAIGKAALMSQANSKSVRVPSDLWGDIVRLAVAEIAPPPSTGKG